MNPNLSEESTARLEKWAEQLKVPLADLQGKFDAKVVALQAQLEGQDVSPERIEVLARKQLANDIRPGKSRAGTYEGIVLGYGPLKDWMDFYFNVARSEYAKDPLNARVSGLTDAQGVPLVTQEIIEKKGQYFRQQVGEVLEHNWERTVLAIGRPVIRETDDDASMRIFNLRLNGAPAVFGKNFPAPPIGMVASWRCNVQETNPEWNWIRANGATVTRFDPTVVTTASGTFKDIFDLKKCAGLLKQVRENFRSEIEDLETWIADNGKTKGMFCVVEGEILAMYERGMRIGDADQLDLENIPSINVKLDPKVPDQMYYGEDSTVVIACTPYMRTARTRNADGKWEAAKTELGEDKKEVTADCIAVFPVIAMPKAKEKAPPPLEKSEFSETPEEKPTEKVIEL